MAFYCNLFIKEAQSAVNTSETAKGAIEDLVIFTLRINIEDADDKNEVAIVNLQINDFVIFAEGKRFNWKWKKLFSQENAILKKLMIDWYYIFFGNGHLPKKLFVLNEELGGHLLSVNTA